MPDKEIMLQIKALNDQLGHRALDALAKAEAEGGTDASWPLREALAELSGDWRTLAGLYENARGKGFKTVYVEPLRHAATELDKVIKLLDQPRRAPLGQLQPTDPAAVHRDAGLDEPVHRFQPDEDGRTCAVAVPHDGEPILCGRFASHPAHRLDGPTERPGLDALIADSVKTMSITLGIGGREVDITEHVASENLPVSFTGIWNGGGVTIVGDVTPSQHPASALVRDSSGSVVDRASEEQDNTPLPDDEVMAYLNGEVNELTGGEPLRPSSVRDMTEPDDDDPERVNPDFGAPNPPADSQAEIDTRHDDAWAMGSAKESASVTTTPAPAGPAVLPVPLLGQPGDMGRGYDHSYIPPGGVPLSFAELLTPVPAAALPPHLSHSQIETIGDCPTKYRAQRLPRQGVPQADTLSEIPQWALIGGNALHAAVEQIERSVIAAASAATSTLQTLAEPDVFGALWREAFDAEIQKIEASQPVPRSRWRASKQGAEGETWWNANGPEMLRRYLAARPDEPTALLPPEMPGGSAEPAIEIERTVDVLTGYGPIPYKVIIDCVTVRDDPRPGGAIALVVRDYKTGDRMPGDTSQLGEYANVLRLLGVPREVKIVGTFFNVRRGVWTPEVDLDEAWPAEWFTYLVTTGHAQRLALTQGPTPARPSSFCGRCSVRWACPVKNAGVRR